MVGTAFANGSLTPAIRKGNGASFFARDTATTGHRATPQSGPVFAQKASRNFSMKSKLRGRLGSLFPARPPTAPDLRLPMPGRLRFVDSH